MMVRGDDEMRTWGSFYPRRTTETVLAEFVQFTKYQPFHVLTGTLDLKKVLGSEGGTCALAVRWNRAHVKTLADVSAQGHVLACAHTTDTPERINSTQTPYI